jgi:uncharacterized protein
MKPNKPIGHNPCEGRIAKRFGIKDQGRPADKWLSDTVRWTWRIKVFMHLELDLMNALRERAEEEAIRVFGPTCTTCCSPHRPANARTMGSTPASAPAARSPSSTPPASCSTPPPSTRTNRAATGTARCTRWPRWRQAPGRPDQHRQRHRLARNRQAGADLIKRCPAMQLTKIVVSEAGASVYSASGIRGQANSRNWTSACAARCRSPAACRTRWPNWSRSTPRPSASASTSTTSARPSWRARSMPSSRTA